MLPRLKLLCTASLLACATLAALPAYAQTELSIVISNAPPPLRYESLPAARPGYVWAPGYWRWNGHRHLWRSGHWERLHRGAQYYAPAWREERGSWRFEPGGWRSQPPVYVAPPAPHRSEPEHYERDQGNGRGHGNGHGRNDRNDHDRDGVPDRHDRDRDGDGVPNRYDHRPDNPRRD